MLSFSRAELLFIYLRERERERESISVYEFFSVLGEENRQLCSALEIQVPTKVTDHHTKNMYCIDG
jgi:hypothetical protein